MIGRALTDVQRAYGEFAPPETDGDQSVLTGKRARLPVCVITRKKCGELHKRTGTVDICISGLPPCHNTEEILENAGYDPEATTRIRPVLVILQSRSRILCNMASAGAYAHFLKLRSISEKDKDAEENAMKKLI